MQDELIRRVDDIEAVLDNVLEAMRECASNDKLHASVRFLADTLAINLRGGVATTPQAPAPIHYLNQIINTWADAPKRSLMRDNEGDMFRVFSDGTWRYCTNSAGWFPFNDGPDCGPWIVLALDVPDAEIGHG